MSDDFEYERRFYCSEFPTELDDGDAPLLIVQSYYVHQDGFALRIRTQARSIRTTMTPDLDALKLLMQHREAFKEAFISVKGRAVGGTRYEAERPIDSDIAVELMQRGGTPIIKNRYSAWIGEDGWDIDVFGGPRAKRASDQLDDSAILHFRGHRRPPFLQRWSGIPTVHAMERRLSARAQAEWATFLTAVW